VKRALSKSQAAELLRAASLLPPTTRDAFLAAVDSRLCSLPHRLNDGDVSAAIIAVLGDTNIRVSTRMFCCDAQPKEATMPDDSKLRSLLTADELREVHKIAQELGIEDHKPGPRFVTDAFDAHRPGQRFATDAARAEVEAVYQDEKRKLQDAWRTPTTDVRGQKPGDQCTIDGQPGHLNHRLECIPDKRQDSAPMTADAAQKIKDEAYAEMCRELEEA
jgi:hypothetical protein